MQINLVEIISAANFCDSRKSNSYFHLASKDGQNNASVSSRQQQEKWKPD